MGAATSVYVGGTQGRRPLGRGGRPRTPARRTPRTRLQLVFSTTKGATAACANLLAQRGDLDIDAPVAEYWPEFKAAGKGDIPVRWLLCHKAGLPYVDAVAHPRGGAGVGSDDPRPRGAGAGVGAGHRPRLPRHHLRVAGRRGRAPHLGQEPRHVLPRRDRRAPRPRVLDRAPRRAAGPRGAADPVGRARGRRTAASRDPEMAEAHRAVHRPRHDARQGARRARTTCIVRRRGRLQQPGRAGRRDPGRQRRHQRPVARPLLRRPRRHGGRRPGRRRSSTPTRSPRPPSCQTEGADQCLMFETTFGLGFFVASLFAPVRRPEVVRALGRGRVGRASPTRSTASASAT